MFWTTTSSRFSCLLTALSDLGHPSLPFNSPFHAWHALLLQAPGFSLGWLTNFRRLSRSTPVSPHIRPNFSQILQHFTSRPRLSAYIPFAPAFSLILLLHM